MMIGLLPYKACKYLIVFLLGWALMACSPVEVEVVEIPLTPTTLPFITTATPTPFLPTATPSPTVTPLPAAGQSSPTASPTDSALDLEIVTQQGGQSRAVAGQGDLVYVGVGPRLWVFDQSASTELTQVGQSEPLPGLVNDIVLVDDLAYVANGDAGLQVLDLSTPTEPRPIGGLPTTLSVERVAVQGNAAYLLAGRRQTGAGQLYLIDIADPTAPRQVGALDLSAFPNGLALGPEVLYVGQGDGLGVFDVSDPTDPVEISRISSYSGINQLALQGHHLYVGYSSGLAVFNVSDPTKPSEARHTNAYIGLISALAVAGDRLYLADGYCEFGSCGGNLRLLDLADPTNPSEISSLAVTDSIGDIYLSGETAYLTTLLGSLRIVDVVDQTAPRQISMIETLGYVSGIHLDGADIYLLKDGRPALQSFHIGSAGQLEPLSAVDLTWAADLVLTQGVAYVAAWLDGLKLVDKTDPARLQLQDNVSFEQQFVAQDLALSGETLYSLDYTDGLTVIDLSDPTDPIVAGRLNLAQGSTGLAVIGPHVYISREYDDAGNDSGGFLKIVDGADSAQPQISATVSLPIPASNVTVAGDDAYVTLSTCPAPDYICSGGLAVVDVTDSTNPQLVSTIDLPGNVAQAGVVDDLAYIAAGESGVWLVDVSDPADPQPVGHFDTPGAARDLALSDDLLYVADGEGGLLVLRVQDRATSKTERANIAPALPPASQSQWLQSMEGWQAWASGAKPLALTETLSQTLSVRSTTEPALERVWLLSDDIRQTMYQLIEPVPGTRLILAAEGFMSADVWSWGLPLVTIDINSGDITELGVSMLMTSESHAWHPTRIGLLALADGGSRYLFETGQLTLVDVLSGEVRRLTDDPLVTFEPAWSPDGQWLAYAAFTPTIREGDGATLERSLNGRAIYLTNPQTGETLQLTHPGQDAMDGWPHWSPDGTRLIYARRQAGYGSVRSISPTSLEEEITADAVSIPASCYYGGCGWSQWLTYP